MDVVLVAEGLVKTYGNKRALDGFGLTIRAGQILGLAGPNGAGKTTFAEVITGLVRPDAGRVTVCGIDALAHPRRAARLIGYSPQELALYPAATVREHLRLFGGLAGMRGAALDDAVDAIAEGMHLTGSLDQAAGLLSGGQRKRTQAATAMIARHPLLILDEPTAGADPETRSALLRTVRDRAAGGTAVVYTTHYLPEFDELGATITGMREGRADDHAVARAA
jgi:ABC-2 type transport system ATP-binding protein